MLAIRLQRRGRKGLAQYRIIVQESHLSPKSEKVVAYLGAYDPHNQETTLDKKEAEKFLSNGAQPSQRVAKILKDNKVKLPDWVKLDVKQDAKTKNPEKLRKNQPKEEEPEEKAEEKPAEDSKPEEAEKEDKKEAETKEEKSDDKAEDKKSEEKADKDEAKKEEKDDSDASSSDSDKKDKK